MPRPPRPPPPPLPPAREPVAISEAAPQSELAAAEATQAAAEGASADALPAAARDHATQRESAGLVEHLKAAGGAQTVVLLDEAAEESHPVAHSVPAETKQQHAGTLLLNETTAAPGVARAAAGQSPAEVRQFSQQAPFAATQRAQQAAAGQLVEAAMLAGDGPARTSQHHRAAAARPAATAATTAAAVAQAAQASVLAQPEQMPNALMWTMQHWLLVVQLSVMAGAVVMLAAYRRQRRPGSPRPLPLFTQPAARLSPKL